MNSWMSIRSSPALVRRYGSVLVGGSVWGTGLAVLHPAPSETAWAIALLLLAPLVLFPLGLRLLAPLSGSMETGRCWQAAMRLQLPAALSLGGAFLLPPGSPAAALSLPWLVMTGLLALHGVARLWTNRRNSLSEWCASAGLVYAGIGGFWAILDRCGARPLQFEPVIVLLTAIHFHYAGFTLPILTALALRHVNGVLARLTGVGVVAAVPSVAVGITATQVNWGPFLECVAALLMASAGVLAGTLYFQLARQPHWPPIARGLWVLAAGSLTGSMVLAAAYGLRFYVSLPGLDIPWMRAWHGTANALGFGFAGLLGWMIAEYRPGKAPGEVPGALPGR